jgi:hypothetical protein
MVIRHPTVRNSRTKRRLAPTLIEEPEKWKGFENEVEVDELMMILSASQGQTRFLVEKRRFSTT